MPFDAAIIDPATHMAGWAPNDFWNQQMQKFVDAEVAKVQKSVDSNRREGIVPRSKSEGALGRKTNRFVTTTGEANGRVDAQRVNMPGRGELSAEFAERKRHNTSTTIDNSGFGGGLTSSEWVSDMHRGQRDLSPEKIRALAPTAEEKAEQRDRKLNFKARAARAARAPPRLPPRLWIVRARLSRSRPLSPVPRAVRARQREARPLDDVRMTFR